jgi:signal transduction histidine kinase
VKLEEALASGLVPDELRPAVEETLEALHEVSHENERWRLIANDILACTGMSWWEVELPSWSLHAPDSYFRAMGYEPDEMPPIEEQWPLYHPDDLPAVLHAIEYCQAHPGEVMRTTGRFLDQEGKYRWFLSGAACMADPQTGEVTRAIGVQISIQELKDAQTALEEANSQLEEANAQLAEFSYVVSHDLKAPLQTVATTLHALRKHLGEDADEKTADLVARAQRGVARAGTMIDDLLDYSVLGREALQREPVPLAEALDRVLEDLRGPIEQAGAVVSVGDLPTVVGDRSQIERLLQNLIANAVKFRGTRSPEVRVAAERDGDGGWAISVTDNGIGIDEWKLARIFAPFQRAHDTDDVPGTGIGLAECQRIAERHGGRIWAESVAGEGSVFRFTLPG